MPIDKEKRRISNANYRNRNRSSIRKRDAKYRKEHPEVKKRYRKGKKYKVFEMRWRSENREKISKRMYEFRIERQKIIYGYKNRPCQDCNIQYPPWIMQFDHRDPSKKQFTIGTGKTLKLSRILEEIAKCDVVCANCHFDRTYRRRMNKCIGDNYV